MEWVKDAAVNIACTVAIAFILLVATAILFWLIVGFATWVEPDYDGMDYDEPSRASDLGWERED